ncbi:MAG: hypothetical protein HUU50_09980 [Candidatus Brocadiae bacterium]|nr:hypothetical protein [Candidatus Brocadiia bacterium]
MILTKKPLPKGYNEFLHFIEKLTDGSFLEDCKEEQLETGIDHFLEEANKRKISVVRCLLQIMLDYESNDPKTSTITYLLSRCNPEKTLKTIISFIKAKEVPDRLKRKLLLLLEKYQCLQSIPELISYFKDKEVLAEYALNSFLKYLGSNAENLNSFAKYLENQEIEFYQSLIANLTNRTDDQSLWLLGLMAEHSEASVSETAIRALGYRKSSLSYEILDNLIVHSEDKNKIREKALDRLAQSGVSKVNYGIMVPHKTYVSYTDGLGNRILLVSRRTGRGQLFVVTFVLNEDVGIRDCSIWDSLAPLDMEAFVKNLEVQTGLKQIDYTLGVKIIEDRLWKIVQNKKLAAPNFLLARRIFGSQKLIPRKYDPNLQNMGIEYVYNKLPLLLEASNSLLSQKPFNEWHIEHAEAVDFVKKRVTSLKTGKIRKDIILQFIKTFIEKQKEKWQQRFLNTADFFQLTSPRNYRNQIEICMAIYVTMEKGIAPASIPFIYKLAENNILHILQTHQER